MKKFITIILVFIVITQFVGCSNKKLVEELQKDITNLNNSLDSMNDEIDGLNKENISLSEQISILEALPTITPTPLPTLEPTPTPLPDTQLENMISEFEKAKLPVENTIYYDETNDPNEQLGRPKCYVGKVSFDHPDCDEDLPCTIEVFANKKDLDDREKYIYSVYDSYPLLRQYVYKEGLALFRLPYDVLPSQARLYEEAFRNFWK